MTLDDVRRVGGASVKQPTGLTVERRIEPVGIDEPSPRLSWRTADSPGRRQDGYRIQVARAHPRPDLPQGALWDSGRVGSTQSTLVPYVGPHLASRELAHWRVRTWDDSGQASPWSRWSSWEVGLLSQKDWVGRWIGYRDPERTVGPDAEEYVSPGGMLQRDFDLPKRAVRARLYITALGLYEAPRSPRAARS